MSMEERVTQFHTDAGRPRDAKTPKDIDRLRKFLFRNQEHRFTEREQSHLFQAVQLYVTAYTARQEDGDGDNPAAALLEDALKMPFTVFTTSHKKTMLKWLERLSGGGNAAGTTEGAFGSGGDSSDNSARWHDVIDIRDGAQAEVMDGDGETAVVDLSGCGDELRRRLQAAFEAGEDEVRLRLRQDGQQLKVTAISIGNSGPLAAT